MKKLVLVFSLLIIGILANGQQTQILWLDEFSNPVPQSKAICKKEISVIDDITTIHFNYFKSKHEKIEQYRNGKPVGKWQEIYKGKVKFERNFDDVIYRTGEHDKKLFAPATSKGYGAENSVATSFKGGEAARIKYLNENIHYPQIAMEKGYQGTTWLQFLITSEGKIDSVIIVKSQNPYLDYEAVRVVKEMPAWNPATMDGKAIDIIYNMPVKFILEY